MGIDYPYEPRIPYPVLTITYSEQIDSDEVNIVGFDVTSTSYRVAHPIQFKDEIMSRKRSAYIEMQALREEDMESAGWRDLHGDVCRQPQTHPMRFVVR
jgi:hypothetical protein